MAKNKPEPTAPEKAPSKPAVAKTALKKAAPEAATPPKDLVKSAPAKAVAKTSAKLAGRGFENLERNDVLLPRLKLTQNGSPEVVDKSAKAGEILLALSGENFGKSVLITPILHFRSRIKWIPKDDGGGIDCSSPDARVPRDQEKYASSCAACPEKEWNNDAKNKKDQSPRCTLYENFLVLINDSKEPVIIPMERTKGKVAKKLWSMGALAGGDMWDNVYKLGVAEEVSANNEPYFNYTVSSTGKKPSDDKRKLAEKFWESMAGLTIAETNQTDDVSGAARAEPAAAGAGKY